jgi:hypothetical protein
MNAIDRRQLLAGMGAVPAALAMNAAVASSELPTIAPADAGFASDRDARLVTRP